MLPARWQDCEYCSKFIHVYNKTVVKHHVAKCDFCIAKLTGFMAHIHQNHGEQPAPLGEVDRAIQEIMDDEAYPKVPIHVRKKSDVGAAKS